MSIIIKSKVRSRMKQPDIKTIGLLGALLSIAFASCMIYYSSQITTTELILTSIVGVLAIFMMVLNFWYLSQNKNKSKKRGGKK